MREREREAGVREGEGEGEWVREGGRGKQNSRSVCGG